MKHLTKHRKAATTPGYAPVELLTIGEVSKLYGVTYRTLRFYEQRGLLKPIRAGDRRFYDSAQTARLQMILKGKHLGFTLTEIGEILVTESSHALSNDELPLDEEALLSQLRMLEERHSELTQAIQELRATHKRRFCS
jgi:DNA-binding transcriptional MerR regulator